MPRGTESHPLCGWMATMLCSETPSPSRMVIVQVAGRERKESTMAQKASSLAHTKWMCKYRIVSCPKHGRKAICSQCREDLGEILRNLCQWKGVETMEGHLAPDHVHMLVSIPPKIGVPGFMGCLKGKSPLLMCVLSLIIVTGFVLLFFATKGQYSLLWGRRGGSCLV